MWRRQFATGGDGDGACGRGLGLGLGGLVSVCDDVYPCGVYVVCVGDGDAVCDGGLFGLGLRLGLVLSVLMCIHVVCVCWRWCVWCVRCVRCVWW